MNYIKELNAFRNWLMLNKLSSGATLLWHVLMSINNMAGWKKEFNATNSLVFQLTGLSKSSLSKARSQLLDNGLIIYHRGTKVKAPVYEMVSVANIMNQSIYQSGNQFENQSGDQYEDQFRNPSGTDTGNILKYKQKPKQKSSSTHASENPFKIYRENFGILRPIVKDSLIGWCRELGDDVVIEGMRLTIKKGGYTFGYIEQILNEWANAKLGSLDQVLAYEKQKAANRKNTIPFAKRTGERDSRVIDEMRREHGLL
ncbi:hypothetical protein CIL03_00420 [Virgibacillus indicus]|uniref:DnaB/C C-terminal domain-containing protein n=1 Tax=Virgibacillus indicus TaxID=2024554 RepID=A0A265NCU9_9BACI|nr:DnaD domain protein [Virgibacillus indicus]OZU89641.1 hypothetical protein CIL03_00420 [Virgibacillus indicus]